MTGTRRFSTAGALGIATLIVVGALLVFGLLVPLFKVVGSAFFLERDTHVCSEGQTLEDVAVLYKTTPESIRKLNPGVSEVPGEGTEVVVKEGGFSLALFAETLRNGTYLRLFRNSLFLGLLVTFLCLLISVPLAVVTARYRFGGKSLVQVLVLVPLILPPFVGAVGIRRMLGRFGAFNLLLMKAGLIAEPLDILGGGRFWAVAALEVLHLFPVMFLNLQAALAARDSSLEDAAETLGDTPVGTFFRVSLPQLVPGVFAGSAITFIWAFTDLGTPLVLEYQDVLPRAIFDLVQEVDNNPVGYALVVETLVASLAVFVLGRVLASRFRTGGVGKGTAAAVERPLGGKGTAVFWGGFGLLMFFAALPHVALALTAFADKWLNTVLPSGYTFQHMMDVVRHPVTAAAIRNSVFLSVASTAIDVVVAVMVGLLAAKWFPRWGRAADALAMVPLAVPGIVMAYGFVASYGGLAQGGGVEGTLFSWLDPRRNPMPLLVLGYAIRRLPFTTRAVAAGLSQVPPELEQAGAVLGADEPAVLRTVTLPLIKGHVLAGAMLTFSFAMLEVSDSIILAQEERFYPIAKAIYHLLARLVDGLYTASALGLFAMALLLFALLAASRLSGKSLGEILRM